MSDSITISGKVIEVFPIQTFDSGFQKRVVRVETEAKYPQTFDIEAIKDKISLIEDMSSGDNVSLACNLNGRLWEKNNKCFATLVLWRVISKEGSNTPPSVAQFQASEDVPF